MIISHQHKFIFIKTEKTAGTSLEIALSSICGEQDIITPISAKDEQVRHELAYRTAQNYFIPYTQYTRLDWMKLLLKRQRLKFYNHIAASEIQQYIAPDIWDTYYTFCFERNPWDKVISWYYWAGGADKYPSIRDFILSGRAGEVRGFDLYSKGGIPMVDKVYKLEEMDAALADITTQLQLSKPLVLPTYRAKSDSRKDKRHYREILTKEEAHLIAQVFAREIQYFDYKY